MAVALRVVATLPPWAMVVARTLLALVLIALGLTRWADGYGPALVAIGSGVLVVELVGAGVSTPDAMTLAAEVVELVKAGLVQAGYAPPAASTPSASGPPGSSPPST